MRFSALPCDVWCLLARRNGLFSKNIRYRSFFQRHCLQVQPQPQQAHTLSVCERGYSFFALRATSPSSSELATAKANKAAKKNSSRKWFAGSISEATALEVFVYLFA